MKTEFEWDENKNVENIKNYGISFEKAVKVFDDFGDSIRRCRTLRRIMENDSRETASIENDILNNEEFLRALKEKLATV